MSLNSRSDASKGLSEFFNNIWGNTEGFVYLPTLDRSTDKWHKVFYRWPEHEKHVVQHVMSNTAQGLDVYFSPALYKGEGPKNPGRPIKENVLGSNVLWVEFDGDAPANWDGDGHLEAGPAGEAATEARSHVPEPSLRVQSSNDGHEHVYWKLDEFCTNVKWIEDKNRSITYSFRSDPSGWDAVQILRPPYTTNVKRDRPVTIISSNGASYPLAGFDFLTPPPQLVTEAIVIDDLPAVEPLIAKYTWDEVHFELFMLPKVEEGSRSSALMRLGYFCIETGMTDTEAYAILFNADERWGKYKGRQDQKRRLVDIIDRARQKHPNPVGDLSFQGLLGTEDRVEQGKGLIFGFKDFIESDISVEWVIKDLLEVGGFGMIASMPGVGKTQMSIQLGIACALGINFLHWEVMKPQKVVFLSLEMSHVSLKMFLETISKGYSPEQIALLQENFIVIPIGQSIGLDTKQGMAFVESLLDEIRPDGVITDSIGKASLEDLNDKTARTLNEKFAHLRSRYNVWMWFIHHNRKASDNNKKPTELSDVYGSVYITADMTSVLILWPVGDRIEVIPVKTRLAPDKAPFTVSRDENLFFSAFDTEEINIEDSRSSDGNGKASFAL